MSTETQEQPAAVHLDTPANKSELFTAMAAARKLMPEIGKTGHNKFDGYDYSTVVDYLDSLLKGTNEHQLVLVADVLDVEYFDNSAMSEKLRYGCRVKVEMTVFHGPSGQSHAILCPGEAFDKTDKALYKAITGARKYGIQLLFNLMGEDDPEKDDREPEAETGKKPKKESSAPPASRTTVRKGEKPPAKDAAKGEAAPTTKKGDADECPPLDNWQKRIDSQASPQKMLDFLTKMVRFKPLLGDKEVFCAAFDHMAETIKQRGDEYAPIATAFAQQYGDVWRDKFDAAKKPDDVIKRIKMFSECSAACANEKLFRLTFTYLDDEICKKNPNKWTDAELDMVQKFMKLQYDQLDTFHQGNEAFGR